MTTDIRIHIRWGIVDIQVERTCIACIRLIPAAVADVPGVQIRIIGETCPFLMTMYATPCITPPSYSFIIYPILYVPFFYVR